LGRHLSIAIEYAPIGDLRPMPGNPRRNDKAIPKVAESIKRFGWTNPILARREDKVVVAGHTRLEAARYLGLDKVPVIWLDLDPVSSRLYNLADNKLGEVAEWDQGALATMLEQLKLEDAAGLLIAGFGDEDIAKILADVAGPVEGNTDPDEVPEVPAEPYVQKGDLYLLGEHLILCGDSTNPDHVRQVLGEKPPELVFTDPPYGIAFRTLDKVQGAIANDGDMEKAGDVVRDALSLVARSKAFFVCCEWRSLGMVLGSLADNQINAKACIVWEKSGPFQHLDRFFKQHEFLVYAGPFGGETTIGGDVWKHDRDNKPDHPTPKPVSLIVQAVEAASLRGQTVYDCFSGSGSTIIACEKATRKCRAIEIEPKYVQVAIAGRNSPARRPRRCRRGRKAKASRARAQRPGPPHEAQPRAPRENRQLHPRGELRRGRRRASRHQQGHPLRVAEAWGPREDRSLHRFLRRSRKGPGRRRGPGRRPHRQGC
jgi:DNA modification methylase